MREHHARATRRSFSGDPAGLILIRRFLEEHAAEDELPADVVEDLLIGVSEAAANAVRHTASAFIDVGWRAVGDRVEVEVRDSGVFCEPPSIGERQEGGLGLPLMIAVADGITIEKGTAQRPGTAVRLIKYRR